MLIEFWEHLRGFDKWTQTEAKIESSKIKWYRGSGQGQKDLSRNLIAWFDASGQEHRAQYKVHEGSPLFQFFEGQTLVVRYNPASPSQYYCRDLLRSQIGFFLKQALRIAFFGLMALALLLDMVIHNGHR